MTKYRLVGSTNSLPHLGDLINKQWHWTGFSFHQEDENTWSIYKSGKPIAGCRVILKNKRFRFEIEETEGGVK